MSEKYKFTKPGWAVLKDKKVYETPVFNLHKRDFDSPNHVFKHPYYVLKAPPWINVIALTDSSPVEVVLVEQFRAGIGETTLEIPGGILDPGETALEAIRRELLEETGYEGKKWTSLGKISSNAAILSNFTYLFLAEGCVKTTEQHTDASEDISVRLMPLEKFLDLSSEGVVHHSIVLAAVARYLLREREISSQRLQL